MTMIIQRFGEGYILALSFLLALAATMITYMILARVTRRHSTRNVIKYLSPRERNHTTAGMV